jgi:hypothetical protein
MRRLGRDRDGKKRMLTVTSVSAVIAYLALPAIGRPEASRARAVGQRANQNVVIVGLTFRWRSGRSKATATPSRRSNAQIYLRANRDLVHRRPPREVQATRCALDSARPTTPLTSVSFKEIIRIHAIFSGAAK